MAARESFELVESIKFFASLVSTEGVDVRAKEIANDYIFALISALKPDVQEQVNAMSSIKIVRQ